MQDPQSSDAIATGFLCYAALLCLETGNKVRLKEFNLKRSYNTDLKALSTFDIKSSLARLQAIPKPIPMTIEEGKARLSPS